MCGNLLGKADLLSVTLVTSFQNAIGEGGNRFQVIKRSHSLLLFNKTTIDNKKKISRAFAFWIFLHQFSKKNITGRDHSHVSKLCARDQWLA